jgi:hypothetical protein
MFGRFGLDLVQLTFSVTAPLPRGYDKAPHMRATLPVATDFLTVVLVDKNSPARSGFVVFRWTDAEHDRQEQTGEDEDDRADGDEGSGGETEQADGGEDERDSDADAATHAPILGIGVGGQSGSARPPARDGGCGRILGSSV